ncbi:MAG TPA: hypothetical protein VFW87_01860 [Pirellulales bacterium]|nr:hypothetical protein [Pirellulales bacterium]
MPDAWGITIDAEFRDALKPLPKKRLDDLRSDLIAHGCLAPLVVWESRAETGAIVRYLIDGHHRHRLCYELRIPVAITALEPPPKSREAALAWIVAHQIARRQTSAEEEAELARLYFAHLESSKKTRGAQREPRGKTAEKVAQQTGKSAATVKRAAQRAKAAQQIEAAVRGDTEATVAPTGELNALTREDMVALAKLPKEQIRAALAGGTNAVKRAIAEHRRTASAAKQPEADARAPYAELLRELRRLADGYIDSLPDAEIDDAITAWMEVGREKGRERTEERKRSTSRRKAK